MSFLFTVFDIVLTLIMLFDTLGMIYQFRKSSPPITSEYKRLCTSWILFLTIWSLFSCNSKGFFGTLLRLIFLAAKIFVTIPKLGGAMKIHKFLIEDGNALKYYNQVVGLAKSKLSGKGKLSSSSNNIPSDTISSIRRENIEPEGAGPSENTLSENQEQGDTLPND